MSFFEALKNTKVTDSAFYIIFVMALMGPGTAYAMVFFEDIFKELDSWKSIFMIVSISAPLLVASTLTVYISNADHYEGDEGMKLLGFQSFLAMLTGSYGSLGISYMQKWDFLGSALVAFGLVFVLSALSGLSTRL